jgi:hypothetical protein
MSELLMKFYQEVIQYENDSIEYGKQLDEEAIHLLEAYKEKFNDEEMEIIKELMYQLAYEAQRMGYVLGVKSVIQIYLELFGIQS